MSDDKPFKSDKSFKSACIIWAVYLVFQVLRLTYRVKVVGQEHRDAAAALHKNGSFAIALWHEQLFGGIAAHAGQKFAPLASLSKDGEIVARVMDKLGFNTIRGSSSRGGPEAREQLVEIVEHGYFTAITIDGPRGPHRRVKGGIVDVARRAQVAILPLIATADREWKLRSWDTFRIPKPFCRLIIAYGPAIAVSPDTQGLAFGAVKSQLKTTMDVLEQAARAALVTT